MNTLECVVLGFVVLVVFSSASVGYFWFAEKIAKKIIFKYECWNHLRGEEMAFTIILHVVVFFVFGISLVIGKILCGN